MATQVKLDYGDLADLESHLTNALNVLEQDLESSATIAADCGDGRLGGEILGFNQSWNKHRYDIKDQLTWLRDSVKNIGTEFEEADKVLAVGLQTPSTTTPSMTAVNGRSVV